MGASNNGVDLAVKYLSARNRISSRSLALYPFDLSGVSFPASLLLEELMRMPLRTSQNRPRFLLKPGSRLELFLW